MCHVKFLSSSMGFVKHPSHGDSFVSSLCLFTFPLPAVLLFIAPMSSTCVSFPCTCVQLSHIPMDRSPCVPLVSLSLCSMDSAQCVSFLPPVDLAFDCIIFSVLRSIPTCSFYSLSKCWQKALQWTSKNTQRWQWGQLPVHFWSKSNLNAQ